MMGPTHRLLGALAGASVAAESGQHWPMVAVSALIATSTAHGWSSPDVDQTLPWRALAVGPLCHPMKHRGITHWFGLPAGAWYWFIPTLPAEGRWAASALLIGWLSHLAGDLVFGRIPLLPWSIYVGLGLDTGGLSPACGRGC
jgi:membrane-bound metal-dependent hydrolase YbcI (DUF457 family)